MVDQSTTPKGNALQPPIYNRARNARAIDNFLWELEAYFGAVGIMVEAQKVSNASFSLKDIALIWWRRRCDDVKSGSDPFTTWDEFKRELKRQFYLKDAEYKARAKLRRLQHQDGQIRECIKEFQELLLEIPNMGKQDALFCFLDGLRGWARIELERCGVQELASTIAAVESLIELKRDSSKG